MTDRERADTYRTFLSRLYTYRNITLDQSRIQQWLSKLDNWGRAADDQMIDDEEWEEVMSSLRTPEVTP
jgi:hypothetical protein